jgi:hypothetical protein
MGHPVALSMALVWAVYVFLWVGDLVRADAHTNLLVSHADSHSLGPYLAVGRGYRGVLAIRQGDARVENLLGFLEVLHAARYKLLSATFNISLASGLAALGRFAESLALIDETFRPVDRSQFWKDLSIDISFCRIAWTPTPKVNGSAVVRYSTPESDRQGGQGQSVRGGPSSGLSLALSIAIRRSASARVSLDLNASSS